MDLFGEEPVATKEKVAFDPVPAQEDAETFQHPRTMTFCLGHEAVEAKLIENFNSGRLAHGLIFSGPKGIGKATMAYRFAKIILNGSDQTARLVTAGAHPDLMSIERGYDESKGQHKAGVDVAEIRKVTPFLRKTAAAGGWRVVIIDDADTMNRSAQNALLKILEEPPEDTVIILVTHRLGALIPTIRSRTQMVNFEPLPRDILQKLLERKGLSINAEELDTLTHLSQGSFGQILQYVEEGGLDTLGKIFNLFQSYPEWNWPDIHTIADSLSRKGQDQQYQNFSHLLQWIFSELTLSKARGQGIGSQSLNIEIFQTLLKNSSLEQLLKICENLHAHFNKAKAANLDKRQAVLGAFSLITA